MTFCEGGNDGQSGKSVSRGGSDSCNRKRGSCNQMNQMLKGHSYGYRKRRSNDSLNESESENESLMMNCLMSLSQRLQQHQMCLKSV